MKRVSAPGSSVKVYEYKGYKIQNTYSNSLYKWEVKISMEIKNDIPAWKVMPVITLDEAAKFIDGLVA